MTSMSSFMRLFIILVIFSSAISQADIKSDLEQGLKLETAVANASELGQFPDQIVKALIANKVDPAEATKVVMQAFPGYVHATSITRAAIVAAPFSAPRIVAAAITVASEFEDDITRVAVATAPAQKTAIKTEADKAVPPFVNLTQLSNQIKKEPEKTERQLLDNANAGLAGVVLATRGRVTATNARGQTRVLVRQAEFYQSDIIKTAAESSVQLRFEDKAIMGLRENSELNIQAYRYAGKKDDSNKVVMQLVSGGFRTISGNIGASNREAYSVSTPAATIGIRGTDYDIIITVGGKTIAAAWRGGITITNDMGTLNIGQGSSYIFASFGQGETPGGTDKFPREFIAVNGTGTATALSAEQKMALIAFLSDDQVTGELKEFLEDQVEDTDDTASVQIEAYIEELNTDPIPVVNSPN